MYTSTRTDKLTVYKDRKLHAYGTHNTNVMTDLRIIQLLLFCVSILIRFEVRMGVFYRFFVKFIISFSSCFYVKLSRELDDKKARLEADEGSVEKINGQLKPVEVL